MKRLLLHLALVGVVAAAGRALAEDTVYFQDPSKKKPDSVTGTIEQESPTGIKIKSKGAVKEIPAQQITEVYYETRKVDKIKFRKPDVALNNALTKTKAKERVDLLRSALLGFQELDTTELRGVSSVHRYLQYRIAQTTALLARDEPDSRDAAITALKDFKSAFADGWEVVPALQMLAGLQEDKGDTDGASQTYADLSELPGLPPALKLQSQLRGARLLMRAAKFADAEKKLQDAAAGMAADDPQRAFVEVALLQARISRGGNLGDVEKKLRDAINGGKDDGLRALAHNALGDYYRAQNKPELAFWEYLKVDTLYTQDREEQAKALYFLAQLFDKTRNNIDRADECRARLKSSQFDGTLYQRLAAAGKKTRE